MKKYIEKQFELYKDMSAQDFIKYLYQCVLGSGHLINNYNDHYNYLLNEYNTLNYNPTHILFEPISDDLVRVHLEAIKKEDLAFMHLLFVRSTSYTNSKETLDNVYEMVLKDTYPFSKDDLINEINKQRKENYPLLSHSEDFRNKYHPHYRLMLAKYIPYLDLLKKIYLLDKQSVISIDGPCASGKSTLASIISEVFDYPIVHVDDFFLQPHQRTNDRLNEAGGNIDYERFFKEVITPLNNKRSFTYQRFDCTTQKLDSYISIDYTKSIVIEGSYSLHPYFKEYATFKIFTSIDKETQLKRIKKRNPYLYERFIHEWIPKEDVYFDYFKIKDNADYII